MTLGDAVQVVWIPFTGSMCNNDPNLITQNTSSVGPLTISTGMATDPGEARESNPPHTLKPSGKKKWSMTTLEVQS